MTIQFSHVKCARLDHYGLECVRASKRDQVLPLLANPAEASEAPTSTTNQHRAPHHLSNGVSEQDLERWSRLSWQEKCDEIIENWRINRPEQFAANRPPIVVQAGPACIPAALLSGALGLPFHLITKSFSDFVESHDPTLGPRMLFAGLPEDFPDQFLFSELSRFRDGLDRRLPVSSLPTFTLLCARNVASLSKLVAKWIIKSQAPNVPEGKKEMALFMPSESSSAYSSFTSGQDQISFSREIYTPDQFAEKIREPTDFLAVATHGFEACADGGGGVVLCGLNSSPAELAPGLPGVLACARGYDCPRGPRPIPLERFASSLLMVASCNGLRLADSVLQPHFNLGLSFVDGDGLAYVSSLFSSAGTAIASAVFGSAMASGASLDQSLSLLNAFLYFSGLDHPAYLAIGNPLFTLCPDLVSKHHMTVGDGKTLKIELGKTFMAELLLHSSELAKQAAQGDLCVQINGVTEPIYWYSYPEEPERLRLFLFSFPHTLPESVELLFCSRKEIETSCRRILQSLAHWSEFAEMTLADSELWVSIRQVKKELDESLPSALLRCAYEAGTLEDLFAQITLLKDLSSTARFNVLASLSDDLLKTFWLSNSYAHRFTTDAISVTRCQNCGAEAVVRILRPLMKDNMRRCVICPRCGIISDLAVDDIIKSAKVSAPATITRETEWELQIQVKLKNPCPGQSVLICPRLSANGWSDALTDPPYAEITFADSTAYTIPFKQNVKKEVPPHRYFIKCLVASEQEIAFVSKVIYVI